MPEPIRIALIDDDDAVLDALRLYLQRNGVTVACFSDAESFLAEKTSPFRCIVADVRLPGMSGLDLVGRLRAERISTPLILITGHGDVDMAVAAIKLGAYDFLEKPFKEARLLEAIRSAAQTAPEATDADRSALQARVASLSERQRQVMELAALGLSNKEISARLAISPRTVEIHRAWMMERMGARNIAELVRMAVRLKG